ncbi:MAG: non-ribosomal peptide synthetase [Opitutus sp.]|nr:non-ribosomal peptide synthetase [Opitutus sp.]
MTVPPSKIPPAEPIAVIGLACRFPGARNADAFWENLRRGVESIAPLSDEQLEAAGVPREVHDHPAYVKRRPLIEDAAMFDASFFGYAPTDAARMDPQHRLFLETAWEAVEHAGYDTERHTGAIGVFAGSHQNAYLLNNLSPGREAIEEFLGCRQSNSLPTLLGNDKDFLTSRVAYKMNLRGPAVTVQTACSTSLVAVVMACDSLRSGQTDMALAGGVALLLPEHKGYIFQDGGIQSGDGHCRAFDASANGTVFGSGVGVVVLKRLSAALADGDTIHAVIRGAALNNDGSLKASYTAPAVEGQAAVIRAAQEQGGVAPDTITYVEAHGTATALGDPVEITALTQAFRRGTVRNEFCALGSVKTNVGHLDAAAGIAGFIKTVLALREKQIPASLHFDTPNPRIDFAQTPFKVVTQLTPWFVSKGIPRRAAVSAFGVGGTNAHVVLEEAPAADTSPSTRAAQLLLLSARTPTALDAASARLASQLRASGAPDFADVAYTLQVGRREFGHRRILVARDATEAAQLLEKPDPRRVLTQLCQGRDTPVVFMFPGQGSQYAGMGAALYEQETVFRESVAVCAGLLREHLELDVTRLLCATEAEKPWAEDKLAQTRFAQPALFTMEYALARLWMSWGIQPAALIGHSLGEYVAATLAGIFTLGRAVEIVAERAKLIEARPPGAMLAVRLPERELQPLLGQSLDLAAVNSSSLCVASGPVDAIGALEQELRGRSVPTIRLNAAHAFHSASMDAVTPPLARRLKKRPLQTPAIPCISSVTGRLLSDAEAVDPDYWAQHARRTVRFAAALGALLDEPRVFLEVGPGAALTTLARQHAGRTEDHAVFASLPSVREPEQAAMLGALGRLWLAGVRPEWEKFHAREKRRRVPLPTYPFERKRHWVEPVRAVAAGAAPARGSAPIAASAPAPAAAAVSSALPVPLSSSSSPMQSSSSPRQPYVLTELKKLFHELSGVEFGADETDRSFLELGLDSLFLTQARQALQSRFGVRLTYRQLQEEAGTLRSLAAFVERTLPPEVAAAPAPTIITTVATEAPVAATAVGQSPVPSQLEDLVRQQIELLRKICGQSPAPAAAATLAQPVVAAPPAVTPLPAVPEETTHPVAFGPFHPVDARRDSALTGAQRRHLEELVERVNRATPRSKQVARDCRAYVADPRALANYRQTWKEMVYQLVVDRSAGARLWDIDGNEYLDLTMGFGSNLLGHSPSFINEAVAAQLNRSVAIGPQSPLTAEVAQLMREFTGMERFTFCNTGSEAVLAAVRIARTVTGRKKIVFFTGDYHGVFDEVLQRAVNATGEARPVAAGIPQASSANVLVLDFARPESLEVIRRQAGEIAAVLVEPVQSRHPEVRAVSFLRELRELTAQTGTVLIFDEMITGFRLHPGGAQALFGVRADLATYGKIIGGGLPLAAIGGRAACLNALDGGDWRYGDDSAPDADVTFFAGTFVRHPLALAAAKATLQHLRDAGPSLQEELNRRTEAFAGELNDAFAAAEAGVRIAHAGSCFRFEFAPEVNSGPLLAFHLLARGVYVRDIHQNNFFSTAHSAADLRVITEAIRASVTDLQRAGWLPGAPVESAQPGSAVERTAAAKPVPVTPSVYPTTEAQREIWLACQFGAEASCAFNEATAVTLRGPLNAEALGEALQDVVTRHDALRTTFSEGGEMQRVLPALTVGMPRTDWSHLNDEERDAHLAALTAQNMEEPFDLSTGPLVRARLIKFDEQHHLLMFTAHHLICDGETAALWLRELGRCYTARVQGRPGRGEPPMQFHEIVERMAQSSAGAASEKFWLDQFSTIPVPLSLPSARPRVAGALHHGAVAREQLSGDTVRELKRVSARHGGTLFSALLAAYQAWLMRLAGQEEVVVAVFNSVRGATGRTGAMGHAVNTLPLRTRAPHSLPFSEFLAQVNRLVMDAREHADFTYGRLVQRLQLPREPGRSPLVDAIFNLDRHGDAGVHFHDLSVAAEPTPHGFVNFDLFLNARELPDRVILDLEYRADLYDADVMQAWLSHFRTLIEAAVASPEMRLAELPLLSAAERRRVVTDWNQTALDYPRNACIHELFEAQVEATPDALAVVAGNERLTYRELNRCANRIANHLRAHGVLRETLVGVCVERSWRMVAAVLGVLKAGGAYVPIDPTHPRDRIEFIARDAQMRAIVTEDSVSARLPENDAWRLICLDRHARDIARESADDPGSASEPTNLAYVLYTSGSTGRPKGVAIEHRSVVSFVHWAAETFSVHELGGVLAATTLTFDLSVFELFVPLCRGGKVILAPNVLALADLPEANEVRLINTVPSAMTELLRLGAVPESVETVNLAGEPVPTELVDQLYELPHIKRVNDLYGPTEATIYATHAVRQAGATPTIGRPIANLRAFILDRQLAPVPAGVPGELFLGGDGLARGYLHQPGLTAEKFIRDPFATDPTARLYRSGDLCRYRMDGQIEFIGRIDHQLKVRGYRIEPGEIEAALNAHAAVEDCVVIAREDKPGDRRLVAYVVPCARSRVEEGAGEFVAALREHVMEKVPPYMVPDAVVPLAELPRTPAGKLDRRALPAPVELAEPVAEFVAPTQELEKTISAIWCEVLGLERIGRFDNFFMLGGHSLLATRAIVRLRDALGLELPVGVLFSAPTISGLAREIERRAGDAPVRRETVEDRTLAAAG